MRRFFVVCFLASLFLLSGCSTFSPQQLGISESDWFRLSKNKQDELRLYQKDSFRENMDGLKGTSYKRNVSDTFLKIDIAGGKVIMPPFTNWYSYQQAELFVVKNGECAESVLVQNTAKNQIKIRACYFNGILFLDPSRYDLNKKFGSVRFNYSPLWSERQGFTYQDINTSGYVQLKGADITIKSLPLKHEIQSRLLDPIERHRF